VSAWRVHGVGWKFGVAVLSVWLSHAVAGNTKEGDGWKQLSELWGRMEEGRLGRAEVKLIERMARHGEEGMRVQYEVLLARYEREYLGDAVASVRRMAKVLLSREQWAQWETAGGRGSKGSSGRVRSLGMGSKREELPPYPAVGRWELKAEQVEAACEAARAWAELGRPELGLEIVDAFGRKYSGWPRALAAECAGNLLMGGGRVQKAMESYRVAVGILEQMSRQTEGLNAWQRRVLNRVRGRLKEAEEKAKAERYGPDWYAYYEAEVWRRREGDLLKALWGYDRVVRGYSGTVYAEASQAYGIEVLLELSGAGGERAAEGSLWKMEQEVRAKRGRIGEMKRLGVVGRRVEVAEAEVEMLEGRLEEMKKLPRGRAAEVEALRRAEKFLTERPWGLYRGEVLVALARWRLEEKLDVAGAEELYRRAWGWLEEVGRMEAALDGYEVPEKAREVTRPPREAMEKDRLGNLREARVEPGMVINRRTCGWYLEGLRAEVALGMGFLSWVKGPKEEAGKWYEIAGKTDPRGRALRAEGWTSVGERLRRALERGMIHATEEERGRYQGRERLAVALAELAYCCGRPERVVGMTERLLAGEFGVMDSRKAQYVRYLRGLAFHAMQDREKAIGELGQALKGPWTVTQDRAAFALANALWGARRYGEAGRLLEELAGSGRQNEYVWRAQLALGMRLRTAGAISQAVKWFERVPPQAPYYAFARAQAQALRAAVR